MRKLVLASCSLSLLPSGPARAQSITPLILEGDPIAGVGLVTGLQGIAITDSGTWLAEVDTDNADTTIDVVLLRNGVILQREGSPVPAPPGALHNEFSSRSLRNDGTAAHIWALSNTPGGTTDNVALYVGPTLVLSKGSAPLASLWGAGTIHNGLSWANLSTTNQILLRGFVTDPTTTSISSDWFASILTLDSSYAPVSEVVLARAGEILPGQSFAVDTVGSGQDAGCIGAGGRAIYRVSLFNAPSGTDSACYLWDGANNVLIANEGTPAPVAGRNWGSLISPEFALNDLGDWVLKDNLDSTVTTTQEIIVRNAAKFVQEGDPVPGLPAFTLTTFGNAPVSLTADGKVLWYGTWNDPVTTVDTGIFLDQTLLVQEGVTPVMGATFDALGNMQVSATAGQNGSMYVSPSGRFVIFTGRVGGSVNKRGIFLLDRGGPVTTSCFGDGTGAACPCANQGSAGNGCANSVFSSGAHLAGSGVASVANDTFVLTASNIPGPGLFFQASGLPASPILFGDGHLCASVGILRLGVVFPTASTAAYPGGLTPGPIHIAGAPIQPGDLEHYQCWYRDAAAFCTSATFNLSNLLSVTWLD